MNILILNWRDIKNPAGGGAEILTQEMAKRWVKAGHTVTQFSSAFNNAKREETIDGVTFIRKGKWWTVHMHAYFYYQQNKNNVDVIIDEVHWFPFFAAVYAPKKTIALTCEVATKLLFQIMPYPLATVFALIEKIYLQMYKNVPTMVISPSTRDDLIANGHTAENIVILPMGLTLPKGIKLEEKEKDPTLVSVGRLNTQKGTLDVIDAFAQIHKNIKNAKLWLVGSGEEEFRREVEHKIQEQGLQKVVTLWGFVSEEKKFSLMAKAHVLISASKQEGWGLTIPEAGAVRTPSVVYNIPGFRDIIIQNKTGILVQNSPIELAKKTLALLKNPKQRSVMQEEAYKQSKTFTWENTAETAIKYISSYAK